MNAEWQAFLNTMGAEFEDGRLIGFGAQSMDDSESMALFDVSSLGVLDVSGADAEVFLQEHFVNDLSTIGDNVVQLSGYCSPKGRLLATFYILAKDDGYWILIPTEVLASIKQRLEMFSRMARTSGTQMIGKVTKTDVTLIDRSSELQVFGVSDRSLLNLLEAVDSNQPSEVIRTSSLTACRLPQSERFLCFGRIEDSKAVWQTLKGHAVMRTEERWNLANVQSGLPMIVLATQEKAVPQMVNLHILDGVSFTKGCYPGQEIIARTQYLGKLKRHMARFRHPGRPLPVGSSVASGDDRDAGWVMASASVDAENAESLVVVKIAAKEAGFVVIDEQGAAIAELTELSLPYPLLKAESTG